MTIKDLKSVTKCKIFVISTDSEGVTRRQEYTGGRGDWQIANIRIVHEGYEGFVLGVELEET